MKICDLSNIIKSNIPEFIFAFYCLAVFGASVVSATFGGNKFGIVLFYTLVLYVVVSLTPKISKAIKQFEVRKPSDFSKKIANKEFVLCFGCSLVILFVWFAGCFPGSFSPDSINQLAQAYKGEYSNWHPALHTWMFFSIPLKIVGLPNAIIPFQIVSFSLIMGYMGKIIYTYAGRKMARISIGIILFSPFTLNIVMLPWKDVAFAMATAMCVLLSIKFYQNEAKMVHLILLSFFIVLTTIFRHNGILFSLPLLLALVFFLPLKKWIVLGVLSVLLWGGVNISYYCMNVQRPDGRVIETMGLPLSVIMNVAKECPDCLDEETSDFVQKLTVPQPNWEKNYDISGFNSIKWNGVDGSVVENAGRTKILKMMVKCMLHDPVHSFMAIGVMTAIVWGVEKYCDVGPYIVENNFGIKPSGILVIQNISQKYSWLISMTPLRYIFCSIGFTIIVILAFVLFKTRWNNGIHIKRMLLSLPILIYDFGTMLFLSGDDYRFFYVNVLICPLVVLMFASQKIPQLHHDSLSENLNQ